MEPETKRYVVYNFFHDFYNSFRNGNERYYGSLLGSSNEDIVLFIELFIGNDNSNTVVSDIFLDTVISPNKVYFYTNRRIELLYLYVRLFYINKKVKVLAPVFSRLNRIKLYFLKKIS